MANAGRILIMPKGVYNPETSYEMLDMVSHNGASWVAKQLVLGIEPRSENSDYWFKSTEVPIANNFDTEAEGLALGALQGKILNDRLKELENSLTPIYGRFVPTLMSGGSGYNSEDVVCEYYKQGRFVSLSFLIWKFVIQEPNDDFIKLSIPFDNLSLRNYGVFGYNSSGISDIFPTIANEENCIAIGYHDSTGQEVMLTGKSEFAQGATFQFQITYFAK